MTVIIVIIIIFMISHKTLYSEKKYVTLHQKNKLMLRFS